MTGELCSESLRVSGDNFYFQIPNRKQIQAPYLECDPEMPDADVRVFSEKKDELVLRINEENCDVPSNLYKIKMVANVPSNIFNFYTRNLNTLSSTLKRLNLSFNDISDLPPQMAELRNLKFLDLSYNSFRHVPKCVCMMENLKSLMLDHNNLSYVPVDLPETLKYLTLRKNKNLRPSIFAIMQDGKEKAHFVRKKISMARLQADTGGPIFKLCKPMEQSIIKMLGSTALIPPVNKILRAVYCPAAIEFDSIIDARLAKWPRARPEEIIAAEAFNESNPGHHGLIDADQWMLWAEARGCEPKHLAAMFIARDLIIPSAIDPTVYVIVSRSCEVGDHLLISTNKTEPPKEKCPYTCTYLLDERAPQIFTELLDAMRTEKHGFSFEDRKRMLLTVRSGQRRHFTVAVRIAKQVSHRTGIAMRFYSGLTKTCSLPVMRAMVVVEPEDDKMLKRIIVGGQDSDGEMHALFPLADYTTNADNLYRMHCCVYIADAFACCAIPPGIVLETQSAMLLRDVLHSKKTPKYFVRHIALGEILHAVLYLHEIANTVHGFLQSRSFVVDENGKCKLVSFEPMEDSELWQGPEIRIHRMPATNASDIYSIGWLAWEFWAGTDPPADGKLVFPVNMPANYVSAAAQALDSEPRMRQQSIYCVLDSLHISV